LPSRAQGTAKFVFAFTLNYAGSLAKAEDQADSVVAALAVAAKSTGVDVDGVEVAVTAARRRLLATFKVTVTVTGTSGNVQTLTVFFASAANQAALLAALLAEGLDASLLASVTSDDSWIGIPIGCSLARVPQRRRLCPRRACQHALRLRTSARQRACATPAAMKPSVSPPNPTLLTPQSIRAFCSCCASSWPIALTRARARVRRLRWGRNPPEGRCRAAAARALARSPAHVPGRRH